MEIAHLKPSSRRCTTVVALCLTVFATGAAAALLDDEEPPWQEAERVLPPAPNAATLRPVAVGGGARNLYFVDEASVSVGSDQVVRYVLVVRAPGGAENVTFEGIRCASGERRIYAAGHGGQWVPMKRSEWQPLGARAYNQPRAALAYDYFCDGPVPPHNREHALRRLQGELDPADPRGVKP
jgi:hypothetical protein